jgi:Ca-activated chloride channel family protein
VIEDFIEKRPSDRFAVVSFAKVAFTQCPLTLDRDVLRAIVSGLRVGTIEDGTAIGLGIATAINRLRASEAKSKVVVLLSDGSNNAGNVSPVEAARMAKELGIRVYTVGVGREGIVPFPALDEALRPIRGFDGRPRYVQMQSQIDETALREVAETTSARFFRADDLESLRATYDEIDRLEKTEIEAYEYSEWRDLYPFAIGAGLLLLAVETVLRATRFRGIP